MTARSLSSAWLLAAAPLLAAALLAGCRATDALRADHAAQAGRHVARYADSTGAPFSYFQYLPPDYDERGSARFPLLVFLHGRGESGDGGARELRHVLAHGPPRLIDEGRWPDGRPFIVLSPQLSAEAPIWPVDEIEAFLDYAARRYRVDPHRIYLTGLSLGGHATWMYAAARPERLAAVAPVSGNGRLAERTARAPYCTLGALPVWAFHGAQDAVVEPEGSILPVRRIRTCTPEATARLTLYPTAGHDAWTATYDLTGRDSTVAAEHDPFDRDLYRWMLQHRAER